MIVCKNLMLIAGGALKIESIKLLNEIETRYQESPALQFRIDQEAQGRANQAAAGGMAGSPMSQQSTMEMAIHFANQDYYRWLDHVLLTGSF